MTSPVHATAVVALAAALATATPTPSPEPAAATGPGIAGFLVTFALVVACIPLFLSMTRKIRGVRFRDPDGTGAAAAPDGASARPDGATSGPDGAGPTGSASPPRP